MGHREEKTAGSIAASMIVLKPAADRDLAEASDWYESKQNGLGVD